MHIHVKEMNVTEGQDHPNITANKQVEEVLLWSCTAIASLCCLIGVFGNGLVIYLAHQNPKRGAFVYLNQAVRNLALTDLLYCLVGIPLLIIWYHWCKFSFF